MGRVLEWVWGKVLFLVGVVFGLVLFGVIYWLLLRLFVFVDELFFL